MKRLIGRVKRESEKRGKNGDGHALFLRITFPLALSGPDVATATPVQVR